MLKKNRVTVYRGHAVFDGQDGSIWRLKVRDEKTGTTQDVKASNVILATGARARVLPGMEPDDRVWTYREALTPQSMPKTLAVIGRVGPLVSSLSVFIRRWGRKSL